MRASRSCRSIKKGGNAQDRNTGQGDSNEPCLLFLPMSMELKKKVKLKRKTLIGLKKQSPEHVGFWARLGGVYEDTPRYRKGGRVHDVNGRQGRTQG